MKLYTLPFFLFVICFSSHVFATKLVLNLKIKDQSQQPISSCKATVFKQGQTVATHASNNGNIVFSLAYDHTYKVVISDDNYDDYSLDVDASLIEEMKKYEYEYKLSINLVPKREGFKVVYISGGKAKIAYNKEKDKFTNYSGNKTSYSYKKIEEQKVVAQNEISETDKESENMDLQESVIDQAQEKQQPIAEVPKELSYKELKALRLKEKLERLDIRDLQTKTTKAELKRIEERALNIDAQNRLQMASKKRKLVEEIAMSERSLKQISRGYQMP